MPIAREESRRSAAREAYDIIEIREKIWQNVDIAGLAACVRLEKGGYEEALKALYYEVPLECVLLKRLSEIPVSLHAGMLHE